MKAICIKGIAVLAILLITHQVSEAVPIEGSGRYKNHTMTSSGIRFNCGWWPWQTCFAIANGKIWQGNYERIIGYACDSPDPRKPDKPIVYLTDEQCSERMTAAIVYNPDNGEREVWYTFNGVSFTETPPEVPEP